MWSTLFLNNYADDSEVARGLTPTVTAVNSPYFLPENSSQRYSVGPSLRYTHLFPDADTLQQNIKSGQGKPVLVLLSYHTGETRDILKAVRPLARHTPLAFRFHPATRPEDYLSYLPEKAPIENRPFQTALENASAVIGSGSGALVEAVCLGKPAVCLTLSEQTKVLGPSHFPLFGQGHLWETAALTENIFGVLTKLIRFQATGDYLNAVRSFRDLLFTKPTPEGILALLDLE